MRRALHATAARHIALLAIALNASLLACAATDTPAARQSAAASGAPAAPADTDPARVRADSARILGSPTAKVWVIVVSDLECPFCQQWHAQYHEMVRTQYVETGKIRLAYINFPLAQHMHAWPVAERAMCAAAQGRFWQYHDAAFATQHTWTALTVADSFLDSLGTAVGVDRRTFDACVSAHEMRSLIQADYNRGIAAGVTSTPTVLIGSGDRIEGVGSERALRAALDRAVAAAAATP